MRADRLLSLLMLLQRHGTMTAAQIADALEISLSTARRDLQALSASGVPVYPVAGRGGGWQLLGDYRTDLTGLTSMEVRALFLAAGAAPTRSTHLAAALNKLQGAIPKSFQEEAAAASEAMFVDPSRSANHREPLPNFLDVCQDAVVAGRQAELAYVDRHGKPSHRTIDPLGIVLREGAWYLFAGTAKGQRTFRVDRIQHLHVTDQPADRPAGFDLQAEWLALFDRPFDEFDGQIVTVRAADWVARALHYVPELAVLASGPPDENHWRRVDIAGDSVDAAAARLAGFAEHIQIIAPAEAQMRLRAIGEHLVSTYPTPEPETPA